MGSSLAVEKSMPAPWWTEITRKQWYALFAGFLGYVLDAFDVMLYAFCLTTIMQAWSLKPAQAGFMLTVTLFSSSIGGIVFGAVADKAGRKLALMLTVLLFSVCSGLSGLSQNLVQLGIFRALLGLGMGGEWAAGVLLISETWPSHHRGKAIGIMQSGWAIGYILAALAAATILPVFGWRIMFMLGVIPALFIVWVRTKVDEPAIWVKTRSDQRDRQAVSFSFWQIFSPKLLRTTLICTMVSGFVMFAYWGLFSWMPGFLASPVAKGGAGLSIVKAPLWTIPMMIGAFFGYVSFGFIADRFGRRPTFCGFLLTSAVLVWLFGTTRHASTLMLLGPFLGFFGSGYFSAFGAFISELFPTQARGSAVGFCYNTGRMLSAFAPTIIGALSISFGLGGALTFLALAFGAGAVSIFLLPETCGTELA
jgi:MFS family permease